MNASCMIENMNINCNGNVVNNNNNNQMKNTILSGCSTIPAILPLPIFPLPPITTQVTQPVVQPQPLLPSLTDLSVEALQKALAHKTNELQLTQSVLCNFLNSSKNPLNPIQNNLVKPSNKDDDKQQREQQVQALKNQNDQLSEDLKVESEKTKMLESQLHSLRCKLHGIEEENSVLNELYVNANRIQSFMASIRKYGKMIDKVKKKQSNLTKCVGMEDVDTFKIRMKDLYDDIVRLQESYYCLHESIDIIKTESQGKELELMTKDREKITWLEKENNVQSEHLDEYVKKNQELQTALTDREMQLRQSYNSYNFIKQKCERLQNENDHLYDQLNGMSHGNININNGIQFNTPYVTDQYML